MKKFTDKLCMLMLVAVLLVSHFVPVRIYANDEPEVNEPEVVEEYVAEEAAPAEAVLAEEEEEKEPAPVETETVEEVQEIVTLEKAGEKEEVKEDLPEEEEKKYSIVKAELTMLTDALSFEYDGDKHLVGPFVEGTDYVLNFYVDGELVENLPKEVVLWFDADVETTINGETTYRHIDKFDFGSADVFLEAGTYKYTIYPELDSFSEAYQIDKPKVGTLKVAVTPHKVTVNVDGANVEKTYDGKEVGLNYQLNFEDDLYRTFYVSDESLSKANVAINAGTYVSGVDQEYVDKNIVNTNPNFDVTFVANPGTVVINKATVTITSASGRKAYDPDDKAFQYSNPDWTIEGLVERDVRYFKEFGYVKVTGILYEPGTKPNEFDYDLGYYGKLQRESDSKIGEKPLSDNYDVVKVEGTLTVYDPRTEAYVDVWVDPAEGEKYEVNYNGMAHTISVNKNTIGMKTPDDESILKSIWFVAEPFQVTGTDAGEYPVELKESMFECGIDGMTIHYTFHNRPLVINKVDVTLDVIFTDEVRDYTGEVITLPAYTVKVRPQEQDVIKRESKLEDKGGTSAVYDPDAYFVYDGVDTISGKEMGLYTTELQGDKFSNTNPNFNVTTNLLKDETYTAHLRIVQQSAVVEITGVLVQTPYNGQEQTLVINPDGTVYLNGELLDVAPFTASSKEYDTSKITLRSPITLKGTDAGIYIEGNWTQRLNSNDQYTDVQYRILQDIALEITPVPLTLVIDDKTMQYGDEIPELTATVTGMLEGEEAPYYTLEIKDLQTNFNGSPQVNKYEIVLGKTPLRSNYYFENVTNGTLFVNPRKVTVTIIGNKETHKYDGEYHTVSGWTSSVDDKLYIMEGKFEGPDDDKLYVVNEKDPGTYYMGLKPELFKNVTTQNFDVTFVVEDGGLKIFDKDDIVSIGTINIVGGDYVFDAEEHPATLERETVLVNRKVYTIEAKISYDDGVAKVDVPFSAGKYGAHLYAVTITDEDGFDVTDMCEYTLGSDVKIDIAPRKIIVNIIPEKKVVVYNAEEQYASYTIEVTDNLDNEKFAYNRKDVGYAVKPFRAAGTEPGTYTCPYSEGNFQNNNNNYKPEFSLQGDGIAELIIEKGEETLFYNLSTYTTTYDGTDHTFTPEIVELNGGDTMVMTSRSGHTYTIVVDPSLLTNSLTRKNAGKYSVIQDINKALVSITDENGRDASGIVRLETGKVQNFTIEKAELKISVNQPLTKNYGDPDPDKLTWVTVAGLQGKDNLLDYVFISREPGENVGEYKIIIEPMFVEAGSEVGPGDEICRDCGASAAKKAAKGKVAYEIEEKEDYAEEAVPAVEVAVEVIDHIEKIADNYKVVTESEGYLEILPVELIIRAEDKEKAYADPHNADPEFTYVVEGLVGSEYLPNNFLDPLYRDEGEEIGDYTIYIGGSADYTDPEEGGDCLDCTPWVPGPGDNEAEDDCRDCVPWVPDPGFEEEKPCYDCVPWVPDPGFDEVKEYEDVAMEMAAVEAVEHYAKKASRAVMAERVKEEAEIVDERPAAEAICKDCEVKPDPGIPVILDPSYDAGSGGVGHFRSTNYHITYVNGTLNIYGDAVGGGDNDPVTPPSPTPATPYVIPKTGVDNISVTPYLSVAAIICALYLLRKSYKYSR